MPFLGNCPSQVMGEPGESLPMPVALITGDDDRIVPTPESVRLASDLPNARLVVIANAGHVPHEEQPGAFMDAVISFLSIHNS